jgi:broad specificity phosphatase PhoE
MCGMGELLLIRHGETAWSRTGQYGGRTDLPLTDEGEGSGPERAEASGETQPGWELWRDGVAGGETLKQVAARADAVLDRARPLLGDVAIVGHGHLQRVLAVRWLGLGPSAARMLSHPHTGTLSALAYEHEQPVISAWNILP